MIQEYINAALERAEYSIIKDEESFYGEVPLLRGVWATGKTLEECRKNLADVIEGWIIIRLSRKLPLPSIGEYKIEAPKEIKTFDQTNTDYVEAVG